MSAESSTLAYYHVSSSVLSVGLAVHMSERRDPAALCSNFAVVMVPKQRQPRGFSWSPGWTYFLAALGFFGFSD